LTVSEFLNQLERLNDYYSTIKQELQPNEVLRYVGELSGDLQQNKGVLETKLIKVDKNSPLGQLSGSDSLFEIYTESYGDRPIIIQGAGAGANVTARGVFGGGVRLAEKKEGNYESNISPSLSRTSRYGLFPFITLLEGTIFVTHIKSIKMKKETLAIRNQIDRTQYLEHSAPLFLTSSFVFEDAEDMRASFAEEKDRNIYSRFSNPNVS